MNTASDTRRAWRESTPDGRRARRTSGAVGSIVVNALLLYAADHLLAWQLPWITSEWSNVVWAVDLSLQASIVANVLFLVIDARWFRYAAGAVTCAIAAVATWWLYAIFPFDFGSLLADDVARLTLLVAVFGTAIATMVLAAQATWSVLAAGFTGAAHDA